MPYNPFVHNPSAETIFNAMIRYITAPSEDHLRSAEQALSEASELGLGAVAPNGTTHLLELFSHTFNIHEKDRSKAEGIVTVLFDLLMKYGEKFPGLKKELLLPSGFVKVLPFFQILSVGTARNVHDYLKTMLSLFSAEESKASYKALLTRTTENDGTILHMVFSSNDPQTISYILDVIDRAINEGVLTPQDLNNLLITRNEARNSVLHSALKSHHGYLLLDRLPKARANGLSNRDYVGLLMNFNRGKFTPLTQCLKTGDLRTLQAYFAMVDEALSDGIISRVDYRKLLVLRNVKNFSTLQTVIKTRAPEKVKFYLAKLEAAVAAGIISENDYKSLLLTSHLPGISLLHDAVETTNVDILKFYFQAIDKARMISPKEYVNLLLEISAAKYTPLSLALKAGTPEQVIALIEIVRKAKNNGLITSEAYGDFLVGPNYGGYTPLDEIFKADMPNILPIYFQFVQEARTIEADGRRIINDDRLRSLLLGVNQDDLTSLDYALSGSNFENLRVFMAVLNRAVSDSSISPMEYGNLLTRTNERKFTPLTRATCSTNPAMLRFYFKLLHEAREARFISCTDYKAVLTNLTIEKFTPLHSIVTLADEESLKLYLEALKKTDIDSNTWLWLLTSRDEFNCSPLDKILYRGNIDVLRLYLEALESVMSILPDIDLKHFLIGSSGRGLSPINSAIYSKKPAILMAYIGFINDVNSARGIITETDYFSYLTNPCYHSRLTPLNHVVNSGMYDLVRAFFVIFEQILGRSLLVEELSKPRMYRGHVIYCTDETADARSINSLIDSIKQGYSLLPDRAEEPKVEPLSETGEPTQFKRMRQRPPEAPTRAESSTGPLRESFPPSAHVQSAPSAPSAVILKHIMEITSNPTHTAHLPPRDLVAETRGKMVAIAQALVGHYGIHPDQISFYGSAAQLIVGHRSLSDAPADIDVRLFAYERHWIDLRENFTRKQPGINITGNDSDPFLLMKGFALPGIGVVDIQIILMSASQTLAACREQSRWASYLNVCADYCTFRSPDVIIPNAGPSHQRTVYFVGPQGQNYPNVGHLYQLYASPFDMKDKDLFFFLKKWHYYTNQGYEVNALKTALINTIAYGHGFNLAKSVFSRTNSTGRRIGAEILYSLCGEVYTFNANDAFERLYSKLLQLVDETIISVLFDATPGGMRVRLTVPKETPQAAPPRSALSMAHRDAFFGAPKAAAEMAAPKRKRAAFLAGESSQMGPS